MRWLWIAVAMFGFILAGAAKSPGVMALGLLLGFVGMFCAVLAFAAARIEAIARPDAMMLSPEELMQIRKRAEAQRAAAGARPATPVARSGQASATEDE